MNQEDPEASLGTPHILPRIFAMGAVKVEHSDLAQHRADFTEKLRRRMEDRLCDVLKSRDGTEHRAICRQHVFPDSAGGIIF